jgi:hypothetical protein
MNKVNKDNPPYISDDFQIGPDGAYEYTEDITMKYVFRGNVIFEYIPGEYPKVVQPMISDVIPAFNYCKMIPEDYKLLGEFFTTVYKHIQGEDVELKDIKV